MTTTASFDPLAGRLQEWRASSAEQYFAVRAIEPGARERQEAVQTRDPLAELEALIREWRQDSLDEDLRYAFTACADDLAAALVPLRQQMEAQRTLRAMLTHYVRRERALREEAKNPGGQHVGYSPSISPSVLHRLEQMLRDTGGAALGAGEDPT